MTDLHISSLPLQQITLSAYEGRIFALKLSLKFEKDADAISKTKDEIRILEQLSCHLRDIIHNNSQSCSSTK